MLISNQFKKLLWAELKLAMVWNYNGENTGFFDWARQKEQLGDLVREVFIMRNKRL